VPDASRPDASTPALPTAAETMPEVPRSSTGMLVAVAAAFLVVGVGLTMLVMHFLK
jgi:hypothetical protein